MQPYMSCDLVSRNIFVSANIVSSPICHQLIDDIKVDYYALSLWFRHIDELVKCCFLSTNSRSKHACFVSYICNFWLNIDNENHPLFFFNSIQHLSLLNSKCQCFLVFHTFHDCALFWLNINCLITLFCSLWQFTSSCVQNFIVRIIILDLFGQTFS